MTDLGLNAGWVLVYAMAIVLVLRLFAGPLVHRFSPLGLLAISALVAVAGLLLLSDATSAAAIVRGGHGLQLRQGVLLADVAGRGGRAVADAAARSRMNVVAGIGMLGAGVIGGPLIGQVLDRQVVHGVAAYDAKNNTQLVETLKTERTGIFGDYTAIDPAKRATIAGDEKAAVDRGRTRVEARCAAHHRDPAGHHVPRVSRPDPVFPQQGRLQARGPRPQAVSVNGLECAAANWRCERKPSPFASKTGRT